MSRLFKHAQLLPCLLALFACQESVYTPPPPPLLKITANCKNAAKEWTFTLDFTAPGYDIYKNGKVGSPEYDKYLWSIAGVRWGLRHKNAEIYWVQTHQSYEETKDTAPRYLKTVGDSQKARFAFRYLPKIDLPRQLEAARPNDIEIYAALRIEELESSVGLPLSQLNFFGCVIIPLDKPAVQLADPYSVERNSIELKWAAIDNAASYLVSWGTGSAATGNNATVNPTGTNSERYTITGLTAATQYYYKVRAKIDPRQAGQYRDGRPSNTQNQTTKQSILPMPGQVADTSKQRTRIQVGFIGRIPSDRFQISYGTDPQATNLGTFIIEFQNIAAAWTPNTLTPNTRYYFKARTLPHTDGRDETKARSPYGPIDPIGIPTNP